VASHGVNGVKRKVRHREIKRRKEEVTTSHREINLLKPSGNFT
jgi:hypothetical protein